MKHVLQLFLILFFIIPLHSQIYKPIPQAVFDKESMGFNFKQVDVFSLQNTSKDLKKYDDALETYSHITINNQLLNNLLIEKPEHILVSIPYDGTEIEVKLFLETNYLEGFYPKDHNMNIIPYQGGLYYKGIINGDYNSLATISFFPNNVVGVVSTTSAPGNIVIAKTTSGQDFIVYKDLAIKSTNDFKCTVLEVSENMKQTAQQQIQADQSLNNVMTTKCVKVYYEICHNIYTHFDSDEQSTLDYISAVHHNVETLYENDYINISMNEVTIWETQDPYTGIYTENLALFASNALEHESDLAHLLKFPTESSVAYLNSLCGGSNYAFSALSPNFSDVPTYSWTISVMAHEMGHSLGSPHTHDCFWNGNNTAIDSCEEVTGNCEAPGFPSNGGTIMSYCHLQQSIGVNLANGFGDQPAQHIRNTVNSKACLSNICNTICLKLPPQVQIFDITMNSFKFNILEESSNGWSYRTTAESQPNGNWINTISNTDIDVINLIPGTNYILEITTRCDNNTRGEAQSFTLLTDQNASDEEFESQKINVYPNPVKDILSIRSEDILDAYEIYDMNSKIISKGVINSHQAEINIQNLSSGNYILSVQNSNGIVTKKFVKL